MSRYFVVLTVGVLLFAGCASDMQEPTLTGQNGYVFESENPEIPSGAYLLFVPEAYNQSNKDWPMILYLHGYGERGDDIEVVKRIGPPKIVEQDKDFSFIVVAPQCPKNKWWSDEDRIAFLGVLLDDVAARYRVDTDRVYATGLGNFATWNLAMAYPNRFAAIAPICGAGMVEKVCTIKHIPTWVFHGADDKGIDPQRSQDMVDALKACGGDVKFTLYPNTGHDCWTKTYASPELYQWFLQHRRK